MILKREWKMAFNDILSDYRNMLSVRVNKLTCLKDLIYETIIVENEEDDTTTVEYTLTGRNDAYKLITKWMNILINESSFPAYDKIPLIKIPSSINTTSTSLNLYTYYTIMSLFIQLEAQPWNGEYTERAEDVNYNLINGYADASKSFEDYNSLTQEFYKRAEYWNVRGHLYEMLAGANEGDFIERRRHLAEQLCNFLDKEEKLYKASPLQSDSFSKSNNDDDDEGSTTSRPITKAEKYWAERLGVLSEEINKTLQLIWNDVSDFHTTLVPLVYRYLRLYENATEYISKGDTFISALQKTSTQPNKSLGESFDRVGVNGFKKYSSGLSKAYEYFVKAKQRRDKSKYKDDDDNNLYLRKYYQHEVLTDHDFFSKAVEFLNTVTALRNRLDI